MGQYLIKFLETEEYLNDFLNGKIFMNTLRYFKTLECNDTNRHDRSETFLSNYQPDCIQIGNLVIPKEDCSRIILNSLKYDFCNIFSMYSLWPINHEEQLHIDEQNKNFGDFCVCVTDVSEFLKRIKDKTDTLGIACQYMRVKYISKNIDHDVLEEEVGFSKFASFSYQKEFRIIVDTELNIDKPFVLDIGSISDIAFVSSINKLNKQLQQFK